MRELFVATAILLLSSSWVLAQSGTPPAGNNNSQYPGSAPSAQQADKSQTPTSDHGAQAIEGCLSGSVDAFALTDANGKTYELTGDTTQLTGRVGHKVRLWGHADSTAEAELITAGGPHAAFGVKQVRSLSACK